MPNYETGALARIGNPNERQYLIEIMTESLGIPARDASRTDVLALLANAAQRSLQYGWLPGVHMHVQKFESKASKEARAANPKLEPQYTYTLVDGEKAWKDSGARWMYAHGILWRYQHKPMSRAEVVEEARLIGLPEKEIAGNAYGIWCRILMPGDDAADPDTPMWSAGVYLGKIRVGNYFNLDALPTGNSSREVARRRAAKRAMMESQLTLIPLDNRSTEERAAQLTDHLRMQAEQRRAAEAITVERKFNREPDGQILRLGSGEGATDGEWEPSETTVDADVDFGMGGKTDEPEAAQPPQTAQEACPECHAPAGKPHTKKCSLGASTPAEKPKVESNTWSTLYANPDISFGERASTLIQEARRLEKEQTQMMIPVEYGKLVGLLDKHVGHGEVVHGQVLACVFGRAVHHDARPGMRAGTQLLAYLRQPNAYKNEIVALTQILSACQLVKEN